MSIFEKYLSIWVGICIYIGITLGNWFASFFESIASLEVAHVNVPVAILIWMMILPMLLKIDFSELNQKDLNWTPIGVTVLANWAFKPFFMAFLAWFFISHIFGSIIPQEEQKSYIAGLIILAVAPCTAMVFVWSNLCNGNARYTFMQVAINDIIMIFAFAPIVGLLLGLSSITVPWETLFLSLSLYLVLPALIAHYLRKRLFRKSPQELEKIITFSQPFSILALLLTVILLFAFQGEAIQKNPLLILLISVPIFCQVVITVLITYWANWKLGIQHEIAAPSSLIAASNFFELAVATAISLFGFKSGAALATVVGVLIEVPLMLIMIKFVMLTKPIYVAKQKTKPIPE